MVTLQEALRLAEAKTQKEGYKSFIPRIQKVTMPAFSTRNVFANNNQVFVTDLPVGVFVSSDLGILSEENIDNTAEQSELHTGQVLFQNKNAKPKEIKFVEIIYTL